jgi:hypothetical protein
MIAVPAIILISTDPQGFPHSLTPRLTFSTASSIARIFWVSQDIISLFGSKLCIVSSTKEEVERISKSCIRSRDAAGIHAGSSLLWLDSTRSVFTLTDEELHFLIQSWHFHTWNLHFDGWSLIFAFWYLIVIFSTTDSFHHTALWRQSAWPHAYLSQDWELSVAE